MTLRVASISIAAVKGLGLVHPDQAELEPFGVRDNRRFYLIDSQGRLLNDKRLGRLVLVDVDYDDADGLLSLRFPDGKGASGTVALDDPLTTEFYGRPVDGRLVAGPWSEALSVWAGRLIRLVRADNPGAANDRGPGAGVTLISSASLAALAHAAGIDSQVDARRFRMLLEISGAGPNEEDEWLGRQLRIGKAVVVPRGNVGRCFVTTHNPDTAPATSTHSQCSAHTDETYPRASRSRSASGATSQNGASSASET